MTPTTPEQQRLEIIDQLSDRWTRIKAHEDAAKAERIEVEEQLLELFEEPETGEGTVSEKNERFKVTTTFGITRSVIQDKVDSCFGHNEDENSLISHIFPLVHKLDLTQLRAVKIANPSLYNRVCNAISAKPRKTSVKIVPNDKK